MSTTAEAEAPHGLAFAVLGPLQLSYAGRPITLGSRKQRMLLACLLVAPDTVVSLADGYQLAEPIELPVEVAV